MDKYEYKIRADEIKELISRGEYAQAADIADTIDWRRVKSVMMLCTISDLYKINRRYEDAKNMLLLAYDRRPGGRTICYSLCELCIKTEELVQALNYYKEFVQVAPKDPSRYILQYKIFEAQDVSLEERISVLEELKKRDYREKWAYELAYLYHRIGLATRCVEECDEMILWFGDGKYVTKAMELKMLHQPLTPEQQKKYDHRFDAYTQSASQGTESVKEEGSAPAEESSPADPMMGDTIIYEGVRQAVGEQAAEEPAAAETAEQAAEPVQEEQPEELDFRVKTIDMGQYNTLNLQAELAAGLREVLEDEQAKSAAITRAIVAPMMDTETLDDPELSDEDISEDDVDNGVEEIESTEVFFGETEEIENYQQEYADNAGMEDVGVEELVPEIEEPAEEYFAGEEAPAAEEYLAEEEELAAEEYLAEEEAPAAEEYPAEEEAPAEEYLAGEEAPAAEEYPAEEEVSAAEEYLAGEEAPAAEEYPAEEEALAAEEYIAGEVEGPAPEEDVHLAADGTAQSVMEQMRMENAGLAEQQVMIAQPPKEIANVLSQESDGQISLVMPEHETVEKQITGQMSIEDILAEWEKMKKEGEERRKEEVRQHVLQQTGNMFTEFEAAARDGLLEQLEGSQADDLSEAEPEAAYEPEPEVAEETEPEEIEEEAEAEPEIAYEPEPEVAEETEPEEIEEEAEAEPEIAYEPEPEVTEESEPEEIEETAESAEAEPEIVYEPESEVAEETEPEEIEESAEEAEAEPEAAYEPEPEMTEETEPEEIEEPAEEAEVEPEAAYESEPEVAEETEPEEIEEPAEEAEAEPEAEQIPVAEEPREEEPEEESQVLFEIATKAAEVGKEPEFTAAPAAEAESRTEIPPVPEAAEKPEAPTVSEPVTERTPTQDGAEPQVSVAETISVDETADVQAVESLSDTTNVEAAMKAVDAMIVEAEANAKSAGSSSKEPAVERDKAKVRALTREEKELFAPYIQSKAAREQLAQVIDGISMASYTGNVIITGDEGMDTTTLAKSIIREVQLTDSNFSGKVAKISGQSLNNKNIGAILQQLENGALIIQKASGMNSSSAATLHKELQRESLGIVVLMEDTKKAMNRLLETNKDLGETFTARMEVQALSNDMLVSFAKQYAKELEYSIDELGILALHTRIESMQTLDHAVTVLEVKQIVDDAIHHASKKTLGHFMDILFAKRYDEEDMIVLNEKDFAGKAG